MKINYIVLNSYGKFKDMRIDFKDGVNIVSGNNEAGKSTIMAFIKAMLYGISGRGNTIANERKRYMPWDGSGISGEICITDDNNTSYVIRRKTGKTQSHDELSVLRRDTGEEARYSFEEDIGIGESAFQKTLYIKQLSSSIDGSDKELTDKLINLVETGDESVGYDEAVAKITSKMKAFKALRGDSGKIDKLKKKILLLNDELYSVSQENERLLSSYKRKRALDKEISEKQEMLERLRKEIENAKKTNEQVEINKLKTERLKLTKELEELNKSLEEKNRKLGEIRVFEEQISDFVYEDTDSPKEYEGELKRLNVTKTLILAFTVIFAIAIIILKLYPYALIPAFLGAILFFLVQNRKLLLTNKLNKIKITQEAKISELRKFGCESLKEYAEKKSDYKLLKEKAAMEKEHLDSLKSRLAELFDLLKDTDSSVFDGEAVDVDKLQQNKEKLNLDLSGLIKEQGELNGFLAASGEKSRTVDVVLTEKELLEEELKNAEESYDMLHLVREALIKAYERVSSNFTPKINETASKYLKKITGNDESLVMDKEYNLTIDRNGMRGIESFSLGTFDQAYLSARLSIIDNLFCDKEVPVFLDDVFAQYDDTRLANTLELLNSLSDKRQMIIFTCKPLKCDFECNYINI